MKEFFNNNKHLIDYLPLMLITLLFITETELEKRAVHISCQLAITIITLTVFFVIVINIQNSRTSAFIVALTIWITLIYAKQCFIPK